MRKLILSISSLLLLAQAATAQHTQTATGFSNTCEDASGTDYAWGLYIPECGFAFENGGGGPNIYPVDQILMQWGRDPAGGYVYVTLSLSTSIDLTLASNQKFSAILSSVDPGDDNGQDGYTGNDVPLNMSYAFRLENADDPQNPVALTDYAPAFNLTGTPTLTALDFSGLILSGADLTTVNKIVFRYDDCTTSGSGDGRGALVVSDIRVGSSVTTDVKSDVANASIALYPNPATSYATVEVNSVSASEMKVTLTDMYGNVVKSITAGATSGSIKETFSTSDLRPGVYFVNYQVGNATKTEKLVIQ